MLPKEEEFRQLKHIMESMEAHNAYLIEVVTWLACCHGGTFVPPIGCQLGHETSDVVAR
jgi:hypothetical protein